MTTVGDGVPQYIGRKEFNSVRLKSGISKF